MNKEIKKYLKYEAKLELARRNFWYYCRLLAPDFYKDDRLYLKDLCNKLQDFLSNDKKILILNLAPRHGKSRTVSNFVEWLLGNNKNSKIMTASYNEKVSTQFSKTIRNTIQEQKADKNKIVYNDIFPDTKIKRGDSSVNLWSIEGSYANYLATSPTGTATGFGCQFMIIDDLIKSDYEANNETIKENHYIWFTNTMLSRIETGGKIIIIATRWAEDDLTGRILKDYKKDDIEQICYAACKDNKMLCEDILSYEEYKAKQKLMSTITFEANYNQVILSTEKQLYHLKTYKELPDCPLIYSYCDVADSGSDYLCNIVFGICNMKCYVMDIVYTQKPAEITEPIVAKSLYNNQVQVARFESNNGGKFYARNIQKILFEKYKSNYTTIKTFTQHKNKNARILSTSSWVNENVYMPDDWHIRWNDFYKDTNKYQKEGAAKHDDNADVLAGICETVCAVLHI